MRTWSSASRPAICCCFCSTCCPRIPWMADASCARSGAAQAGKRGHAHRRHGRPQARRSLMILFGLLSGNFMLVFVGAFIYLGAWQEGTTARGRSLTSGFPVRAAMITDFRTLPHGATIKDAADLLLATSQHDFPVVHGDQVIGLLGRSAPHARHDDGRSGRLRLHRNGSQLSARFAGCGSIGSGAEALVAWRRGAGDG